MRFVQALRFAMSRVVLIVFGILAAIGLLEGLLHLVSLPTLMELNRQQIELWQSDDELVLHLKPNMEARITAHPDFDYTIRTNDLGLRDGPLRELVDIATIGDSFTFGFGVDEPYIWPTRLEELSTARVANLGWAGWNSYVYPATIRRYAVPLGARLWIWSFFSNDLIESVGAEEFLTSGKTDYLTEARQAMDPGFPYNLRTFELLMTLLDPKLTQMDEFSHQIFDNGQFRMRLSYGGWEWTDPDSPDVQRGWELTEAALVDAQQLAAKQDATLVLVFVPTREHVYWPIIKDEMPGVTVEQLDSAAVRLAQIAADNGIAFLNLLPGFRAEAEQGHMLYFPADGHWNPAGHQLAARLIHDYLIETNLLP